VLDQVTSAYPLDCTIITYHVWWPGPDDPFWLGDQTDIQARTSYYGVGGVPAVKIDGFINGGSNDQLKNQMLQRRTAPSPLILSLSGTMQTGTTGTVTVQITNTSGTAVSGNLHIALTENDIPYAGKVWNGVLRDFIPSGAAGEAISVGPGDTITRDAAFTVTTGAPPSGWDRRNLVAIAFVQNDATREILQAGRIFFELDQPELRAETVTLDDTAGGDGDGSLDPGEWVYVRASLRNLNPILATSVTGTLSASDAHLTVTDPSATWPDIAYGQAGQNDADPFVLTASADLPVGFYYPLTLTVTSVNGYATTIPLTISSGSPDMVSGPDSYGYYAYENIDPYLAAPVYNWVEIDPTLGGPGTLFTLYGDQTRTITLPFTFRYEGTAYTTLSIGSNGWVAPGTTTDTTPFNGNIPGPEGPPNMIAAFWTDLQPSDTAGGKVYTYYDATHHRYLVEYSGVLHANGTSPETFEFILYDPAHTPTPTNDGEIVLQYAHVSDASGCTVGIENTAETQGIEYLALGVLNPTAQGLAAGRAIKFTTVVPNSAGVDGDGVHASSVMLSAWPNPARGGAQIVFDLPAPGRVTLRVYDLAGTLVRTLVDGARDAGPGRVAWDGRADGGRDLPAGVYFYRLNGPGVAVDRRIVKLP
jgi:hypothetical protein